ALSIPCCHNHSTSCIIPSSCVSFFFFSPDTPTSEIYTLSLHDALPIFNTLLAWETFCCAGCRSRWVLAGLKNAAQRQLKKLEESWDGATKQSKRHCRALKRSARSF